MFVNRGDNGDATDNNASIAQILQLRDQRKRYEVMAVSYI